MIRFFLILIMPLQLLAQPDLERKVLSRSEKLLKKEFNKEVSKYEFIDTCRNGKLYKLHFDDKQTGYIVYTRSKGRAEYFDYMILYSEDLKIQLVRILKYNSSYGTGVASKRWLKQFIGNRGESLRYGNDIQAISGATFSATSLTNDIPKVSNWVYEILSSESITKKKLENP